MSIQALDVRIDRRLLNVVIGLAAMAVVVAFVLNGDFASTIDSWLIGIVGWVAPWAAVVLVHWFVVARQQIDPAALLAAPEAGLLPSVRPTALAALGIGVVFTWLFMYGMTPLLQGPIASAMGGVDLSWLAGGVAAGISYVALQALRGLRAGR